MRALDCLDMHATGLSAERGGQGIFATVPSHWLFQLKGVAGSVLLRASARAELPPSMCLQGAILHLPLLRSPRRRLKLGAGALACLGLPWPALHHPPHSTSRAMHPPLPTCRKLKLSAGARAELSPLHVFSRRHTTSALATFPMQEAETERGGACGAVAATSHAVL